MSGALTAIALGSALLLAGVGFDSPSLLVPGIGFLGLAVAAVLWVELARPSRLTRAHAPKRVIEGDPYPLCLRAEGARLPPPGGALTDPVLEAAVGVGPRWQGVHDTEVRLHGRGRRILGPARLRVRDPLGLWERTVESEEAGELLILPRIEPVVAVARGDGRGRSRSIGGIEDNDLPYGGGDQWLRLTLLLFAPLLLCVAAVLGFWPARRRAPLRALALGALITLYGFAVTLDSPGAELLWGLLLTVLAAAWLWLPQLDARHAGFAVVIAAGFGLLALPAAAAIDPERPLWDYENWDWFAVDSSVSFEWNHTYGPLDWQREGTTLLEVQSTVPLYWKASVLDRFDGFTWQRAQRGDPLARRELLARLRAPGAQLPELRRDWLTQASFEVAALSSDLVIGTGTPQAPSPQGIEGVTASRDGTLVKGGAPLQTGDVYSILAYAPQPTDAQLRRAPATYPKKRFADQTLVALPSSIDVASDVGPTGSTAGPGAAVALEPNPSLGIAEATRMPLWGERDRAVEAALRDSPYAEVYALARRLTAGLETPYEASLAIESHLRESYDYTPDVPQDTYPLRSFLFEDEAGYCQQFAGSMGLMLRMVGVPTRVVSGFAPGSFDADRGVYEVRDFDAHSWVEVYFRRIGWVTFDPTPAAAPASSQADNLEIASFFRGGDSVAEQGIGRARSLERALEGGIVPQAAEGAGPWSAIALGVVGITVVAGSVAGLVARRRSRRLARGELVDAQLEELRRALVRLGWSLPREVTLLALEQRFRTAGRGAIAAYASGLRRHRYAGASAPPPGPGERRALRRALAARGGLRQRLRGLLAIPPGGPRTSTDE